MDYYFHESMVAKMIASNEYQQGYSVGFSSGYDQGRLDAVRKFTEWCKIKGYGCYDWRMLLEQYEKEQK